MNYCEDCGYETNEEIDECPECEGGNIGNYTTDKNTNVVSLTASPSNLNNFISMLALKHGSNYVYPKMAFKVQKDGIYTTLLCPSTDISTIAYFKKKYFNELIGVGEIPIDSDITLDKRLKWFKSVDECSLIFNETSNVLMYYASDKNKMSDNASAIENINTYMDDTSDFPFKVSMENFSVKYGKHIYKDYYATVRVSEIKSMIKKLSDFGITQSFPITFSDKGIHCQIGEVDTPADNGSFVDSISIIDIKPAPEPISANYGEKFINLFESLPVDTIVKMYFVPHDNFPVWILLDVVDMDSKNKHKSVLGNIGHMLAPRKKLE